MRISTITVVEKPQTITVRHYDNAVVNIYSKYFIKHQEAGDFEIGQFRIKYRNKIPKECGKTINFEDKLNH
jgi:hypothetical protein